MYPCPLLVEHRDFPLAPSDPRYSSRDTGGPIGFEEIEHNLSVVRMWSQSLMTPGDPFDPPGIR